MLSRNQRNTFSLLTDCAMSFADAFAMFPELATFCPARFVGLRRQHVSLELYPATLSTFCMASVCCVTFRWQHQPHVFLAAVVSYGASAPEQVPVIDLEFPTQILADKRRASFRVPVMEASGLAVQVNLPSGKTLSAKVVNLSLTGTLLSFPECCVPDCPVGSLCRVAFMLDTRAVSLTGELCRRDGNLLGFSFADVSSGMELDAPADLSAIVQSLEHQWFDAQVRQSPVWLSNSQRTNSTARPRAGLPASTEQFAESN